MEGGREGGGLGVGRALGALRVEKEEGKEDIPKPHVSVLVSCA